MGACGLPPRAPAVLCTCSIQRQQYREGREHVSQLAELGDNKPTPTQQRYHSQPPQPQPPPPNARIHVCVDTCTTAASPVVQRGRGERKPQLAESGDNKPTPTQQSYHNQPPQPQPLSPTPKRRYPRMRGHMHHCRMRSPYPWMDASSSPRSFALDQDPVPLLPRVNPRALTTWHRATEPQQEMQKE